MRHQTYKEVPAARRVRTLAAAFAALVAGAAFYAQNVRAADCGAQRDFIAPSDRLDPTVKPADCATLLAAAPEFAWPATRKPEAWVVTVTSARGEVRTAVTASPWLAWEQPLPAGEYTWTVTAVNGEVTTSAERRFAIAGRG